MKQLTDNMIKNAFDELAVDNKYFDKFKEVVERSYSELQRDCPNDDEDESNADVSIRFSIEFMKYYVPEKEKGNCDSWADTYARNRCCQIVEYISYREAYDAIVEKEDREKELDIHVASMSTDPLFKKRYKYLFTKIDGDPKEATENYCKDYRRMIALGKSEFYAQAYADSHDDIYAQAYELAKEHGMDSGNAYDFGDICTESLNRILLQSNEFLKLYHEEWQKDFYFNLIKENFEESEHRKMSQQEETKFRKALFG